MPHVLIVAHEPSLADALERTLSSEYSVTLARTSVDALHRLAASPPFDVVLCEVDMPDMTGAELLERALSFLPDAGSRFLFMNGRATARGRALEILEGLANSLLEAPPGGVIDVASLWSGGLPPSMA
jgi:CheY-like chemotaxis protein